MGKTKNRKRIKSKSFSANKFSKNNKLNIRLEKNNFKTDENFSIVVLRCLESLLSVEKSKYHADLNRILNIIYSQIISRTNNVKSKNEILKKEFLNTIEEIKNIISEKIENKNQQVSDFYSNRLNEILKTIDNITDLEKTISDFLKNYSKQSELVEESKMIKDSSDKNKKIEEPKKEKKTNEEKEKSSDKNKKIEEPIKEKKSNKEKSSDKNKKIEEPKKEKESKEEKKDSSDINKNLKQVNNIKNDLKNNSNETNSLENDDLDTIKNKLLQTLKKRSKKSAIDILKVNAFIFKKTTSTILFFPFKATRLYFKTFFKKAENEKPTFLSTLMKIFLLDKKIIFWTTVFITMWFKNVFTIFFAVKNFIFDDKIDSTISKTEKNFLDKKEKIENKIREDFKPIIEDIKLYTAGFIEFNKWFITARIAGSIFSAIWDLYLKNKFLRIGKFLIEFIKRQRIVSIISGFTKTAAQIGLRYAAMALSNPIVLGLTAVGLSVYALWKMGEAYSDLYKKEFVEDNSGANYTQIMNGTDISGQLLFDYDEHSKEAKDKIKYFSNDINKSGYLKNTTIPIYRTNYVGQKVIKEYEQKKVLSLTDYNKVVSELKNSLSTIFDHNFFSIDGRKTRIIDSIINQEFLNTVFPPYKDTGYHEFDKDEFDEKVIENFNKIIRVTQLFKELILSENGILAKNLSNIYNSKIKTSEKNDYTILIFNDFLEIIKQFSLFAKEDDLKDPSKNFYTNITSLVDKIYEKHLNDLNKNKNRNEKIFKVNLKNFSKEDLTPLDFIATRRYDTNFLSDSYIINTGFASPIFYTQTGIFGDEKTETEVLKHFTLKNNPDIHYAQMNPLFKYAGFKFGKNNNFYEDYFVKINKISGNSAIDTFSGGVSELFISEANLKDILQKFSIHIPLTTPITSVLDNDKFEEIKYSLLENRDTSIYYGTENEINLMKEILIYMLDEIRRSQTD